MQPSTGWTTSGRSCSPSTSSPRSSTTRPRSEPSPRTNAQRRLRHGRPPLLALSVAAFPEELAGEAVAAILAAADAKVREAGALLAGGHTIRDNEPKYGLAVVGTASLEGIWRKSTARPGDALFLTKPLGTGLVLTGVKKGTLDREALQQAIAQMTTLNRDAADALRPHEPSAVTDITGFGLFGHAVEIAERSGVAIVLEAERLPALDGALEVARAGLLTGGDERNRDFAAGRLTLDGVPGELAALGFDPQTAGGLLAALPPATRRCSRPSSAGAASHWPAWAGSRTARACGWLDPV